jgi:MFS family permease
MGLIGPRDDPRPPLWSRDFTLTVLGTFNFFASFFLLLSVVPDYVDEIGGEEWQVGLVFAGFSILPILVWPWVGLLSDRGRRKALMYASIAIFIGAMALMALSQDVWSLFALRLVQGLGMAAFPTAGASLIGVVAPLPRRGEGVGYYGLATSAAQMIFPALGVLMVGLWSFDAVFLIGAAMAATTLLVVLPIREPSPGEPPAPNQPSNAAAVARSPRAVLFPKAALFPMAIFFAVTLSFSAAAAFLPLLGDERDLGNVGLFFLASGAMSLVVRPFAGPISDRAGRTTVIVPGLLTMAVGMAVLAQAGGTTMLIVAGLINGLGFGMSHTGLFTLAFDRVAATQRGGATAMFRSAWDSGGLIGGVGLGAVASALDVETAFWVAAAVLVLAAAGYGLGRGAGWTVPYEERPRSGVTVPTPPQRSRSPREHPPPC